jgi:energy-coupling factor transport system permease protein
MAFSYIPAKSFLHSLDPRTKLVTFLVITFSAVQITDPIVMASMLVVLIILSLNSHIPMRKSASLLYRLLPLLTFYFIFNLPLNPLNLKLIQDPTKILFYMIPFTKWAPITGEGMVFSLAMLFRFALIVYSLQVLITFTTQTVDISRALIKWKVPAPIALTAGIGFTFVPVLGQSTTMVMDAQKCRGGKGVDTGNTAQRLKALINLLIPIIVSTVKRAQFVAVAIESRGFGYNIEKRTFVRETKLAMRDFVTMAILIAYLAGISYLTSHAILSWNFTWSLLQGLRAAV